jgi:hypothetical protein
VDFAAHLCLTSLLPVGLLALAALAFGFPRWPPRGISKAMSKKPPHFAYLIAIRQPDETDRIYAILAMAMGDAIQIAAEQEPTGPAPRHVGLLGASIVKRMKLKIGDVRIV